MTHINCAKRDSDAKYESQKSEIVIKDLVNSLRNASFISLIYLRPCNPPMTIDMMCEHYGDIGLKRKLEVFRIFW